MPPPPLPRRMDSAQPPTTAMNNSVYKQFGIPATTLHRHMDSTQPPPTAMSNSSEQINIPAAPAKTAHPAFKPGVDQYVMFFTDPAFNRDVDEFFGIRAPVKTPRTAHYTESDFRLPYKAADDDLAIFRERAGTSETEQEIKIPGEGDRARRVAEGQEILRQVESRACGV